MSTSDIVIFLKERYAEDVETLRLQDEHHSGLEKPYDLTNPTDPARALIEVEAKQRILKEVTGRYLEAWIAAQVILNALALPYAWHEDYDSSWAKGL